MRHDCIQHTEFLPNLLRNSAGEIFDLVDRFQDNGIKRMFDVKHRDFSNDGEQFRTVIKITTDFKRGIADGWRDTGAITAWQKVVRRFR